MHHTESAGLDTLPSVIHKILKNNAIYATSLEFFVPASKTGHNLQIVHQKRLNGQI